MDKKNTLLLTVVAIATLLVALVGATFAFFTATNNATGETTVETTTEVVGAVGITNPTASMHINLQAHEMTKTYAGQTGKSFYATASTEEGVRYSTTQEDAPISRVTITGSEDDTVYTCTYTLEITQPEVIKNGDMALILTLNGATIDGVESGKEIDLKTVPASYTVNFTQKGNVKDKDIVKAAIKFTNKTTEQDYLIDETLTVTVKNSTINCTVSK